MLFAIYPDSKKEWRWRLRADNGKIIAVSSEGYTNKSDCRHAIELVKQSSNATVIETNS